MNQAPLYKLFFSLPLHQLRNENATKNLIHKFLGQKSSSIYQKKNWEEEAEEQEAFFVDI